MSDDTSDAAGADDEGFFHRGEELLGEGGALG